MSIPDYYAVLGIEPAADLQQIKSAYRRRAMQCHPDRGGSHEQMLHLNEAFQVLVNPQTRQQYDQARANASAAWAGTPPQAEARTKAEEYPRQWNEFDGWLDAISADFAKAEYGIAGEGMLKLPTAGPSASGWLFILGCAAGGAWLAHQWYGEQKLTRNIGWIYIGLTMGGAWLGKEIHQFFGGSTKSAAGPSSEPLIVACRSCGQKLRVQSHDAGRVFRCGKCQAQFTLPDRQPSTGK